MSTSENTLRRICKKGGARGGIAKHAHIQKIPFDDLPLWSHFVTGSVSADNHTTPVASPVGVLLDAATRRNAAQELPIKYNVARHPNAPKACAGMCCCL